MSTITIEKAEKGLEARGVCASRLRSTTMVPEVKHAPESDFEWVKDKHARSMLELTNTRQHSLESSLFDIMEYLKMVHHDVKMMNRRLYADLLDDYDVPPPPQFDRLTGRNKVVSFKR